MSPRLKKEYVEAIFLRFKKASRKERTIILDEFCATCGYHLSRIFKDEIRGKDDTIILPIIIQNELNLEQE